MRLRSDGSPVGELDHPGSNIAESLGRGVKCELNSLALTEESDVHSLCHDAKPDVSNLKTRHALLEETKHIEALRSLVEAFSANQKNDQKGASPNPPDGAGMYLQAGTASHRSFSSNSEAHGDYRIGNQSLAEDMSPCGTSEGNVGSADNNETCQEEVRSCHRINKAADEALHNQMLEDKETPQLAQPQYDLRDSQSNTRITRMPNPEMDPSSPELRNADLDHDSINPQPGML
ncbi:hypothetical protein RRG08_063148 [Elysia crispata]|uniref:Uncharacterized protein n=1 Tax=Elysia crispata TaxID=231223 RepID=A0AAE0ZDW9_9GAST|nr:hypothetical protein RRG08_063148 [Elysia crispata]